MKIRLLYIVFDVIYIYIHDAIITIHLTNVFIFLILMLKIEYIPAWKALEKCTTKII